MYVVKVKQGSFTRRFLVKAASAHEAQTLMYELNIKEKKAGEPLFDSFEYVEPVEFEQNVMEI